MLYFVVVNIFWLCNGFWHLHMAFAETDLVNIVPEPRMRMCHCYTTIQKVERRISGECNDVQLDRITPQSFHSCTCILTFTDVDCRSALLKVCDGDLSGSAGNSIYGFHFNGNTENFIWFGKMRDFM